MANFFARLANAVLIRLHVLYDMVMGESTLRDLKDPTLFLKQCKHMAEHELDVFLGSDLLKCFAREHEEETDKYVVELFVAEGDTNGRGAKPRRYFLDLT